MNIDEMLREGKLEQACPDCGRWEAAGAFCSWCSRPMVRTDWYRNGDAEQRAAGLPTAAPPDPPSEYRHSAAGWPPTWGPYPGERRPRDAGTPKTAVPSLWDAA